MSNRRRGGWGGRRGEAGWRWREVRPLCANSMDPTDSAYFPYPCRYPPLPHHHAYPSPPPPYRPPPRRALCILCAYTLSPLNVRLMLREFVIPSNANPRFQREHGQISQRTCSRKLRNFFLLILPSSLRRCIACRCLWQVVWLWRWLPDRCALIVLYLIEFLVVGWCDF